MLSSVDCNAGSLGVAADTGVKEIKDLKGKRVGFVVGSPALNQNALAVLAFGGLTQNDVKLVEFASYGAMWKGLINNDADAAFGTTITGPAKEAETSPRGLVWPPLPAKDKAGWERMQEGRLVLLPAARDLRRRHLAGEADRARQLPLPDLRRLCLAAGRPGLRITKAMIVDYDAYKDSAPGAGGLAADRQTKNWVVPVHPGAVKALKEAGQWTAEQEAHNNSSDQAPGRAGGRMGRLRQVQSAVGRQGLPRGWMKARAAALAKAGMPNGFDE